jgi:CheY-like chemotaxis protein
MTAFRKRVLWVDDEIELLRAHIMFLETRGYDVVPVFSGDDAIELVRERGGEFDIVLLDEQMPGKDGLTTLEEIKKYKPDLPVVMVTKSEEENLMEQALGKKIDGYLTKPVNPSQILLICKRLLDSKLFIASEVKQQFLRNYSENTTALRGRLEPQQWIALYENFARWDAELDTVEDEGLRQTHAGQKSDGNAAFANFIIENYGYWIRGENNPPPLSAQALDRFVDPLLRDGKQVYCIIISGMRLDQYLGIEESARKFFNVSRNHFFSILPTDACFSRAAFLAGAYPSEIAEQFPEWKPTDEKNQEALGCFEEQFLRNHLEKSGIDLGGHVFYTHLTDAATLQAGLAKHRKSRLTVIVADFVNLLAKSTPASAIAREIAPDERALRSITRAWFGNSVLLNLFKELARKKCAVVLTSDHGIMYCSRKTEIYGARQLSYGLRYKFGKDITADDRRVVALSDPRLYKLPRFRGAPGCIIARENYYFTPPASFKDAHKETSNTFQQGGISMEEMIMPLAVFTPL